MPMSEGELRAHYERFKEVYNICWKFFRRNVVQIEAPDFWEKVAEDNCRTWEEHNHNPLLKGYLAATTKEIERIYDERNAK